MQRAFSLLFAIAFVAGSAGCGRYQLGTGKDVPFSTLFVSISKSEVLLPQARALVTTQVRDAFLKDGRVRLVDSPDEAEATLDLTLEDYSRNVTVALPQDTGLARRFELTLVATATLTDNRTAKAIFAGRTLTARRGAFTDSGQIQSEYQVLPLLASRLADEAVRAVLDTW